MSQQRPHVSGFRHYKRSELMIDPGNDWDDEAGEDQGNSGADSDDHSNDNTGA